MGKATKAKVATTTSGGRGTNGKRVKGARKATTADRPGWDLEWKEPGGKRVLIGIGTSRGCLEIGDEIYEVERVPEGLVCRPGNPEHPVCWTGGYHVWNEDIYRAAGVAADELRLTDEQLWSLSSILSNVFNDLTPDRWDDPGYLYLGPGDRYKPPATT